jgi:hypothetical protein
VPLSKAAKISHAIKLYENFSGHTPEFVDSYRLPVFDVALKVGDVLGILYETVRDGKTETYIHKFKKAARPLLTASFDGKNLYLLGGAYTFTERGIVDDK